MKKLARRQKWRKNIALRHDEWSGISTTLAKRKHEGKETAIIVHGLSADSAKLERSIKRHQRAGGGVTAASGKALFHYRYRAGSIEYWSIKADHA